MIKTWSALTKQCWMSVTMMMKTRQGPGAQGGHDWSENAGRWGDWHHGHLHKNAGNSSHTCCPNSIWEATADAGLLYSLPGWGGGIGIGNDDNPVTLGGDNRVQVHTGVTRPCRELHWTPVKHYDRIYQPTYMRTSTALQYGVCNIIWADFYNGRAHSRHYWFIK